MNQDELPVSPGSEDTGLAGCEAHASRGTDLAGAAVNLMLAVFLGVLACTHAWGFGLGSGVLRVLSGIGAVVTGWGGLRWIRRSSDRRPRISISSEGITDRTGLGTELTIPWAEVLSLELSKAGALELRVRRGVRVNWHRRLLTRLLRKDKETGLAIPLRALSVSQHVLAAEARSQFEEHERRALLGIALAGERKLKAREPGR